MAVKSRKNPRRTKDGELTHRALSILLLLFLGPALSAAGTVSAVATECSSRIPDTKEWAFARALLNSAQPLADQQTAMQKACIELDQETWFGKFVQAPQPRVSIQRWVKTIFKSMELGAISFSVLGADEVQENFKNEVAAIKENPDPLERIQAVYELVVRYQGEYRRDKQGLPSGRWVTFPGPFISEAASSGSAGICRDFATLLYWSLLQVARPSNPRGSLGALGDDSFSFTWVQGTGPYEGTTAGHQWLRVHLPRWRQGVLEFEDFDLDSTWYKSFTPVMPRQQNRSHEDVAASHAQCLEILTCLQASE